MHHENKSVDNKLTTIILQYRKNVTDKASDNDVVEAVKKMLPNTKVNIYTEDNSIYSVYNRAFIVDIIDELLSCPFFKKLNELRNNTEEYTKVRNIIFNKIIKEKEKIDEGPITWHIIRFCEKAIEEYLTNNGYYSETNKKFLKRVE